MFTGTTYYRSVMPPIAFNLVEIAPQPPSWHNALMLFYVSEGHSTLSINGISYHLAQNQLAIVSPMSIYSIVEGTGVAAIFQVDVELVCKSCPDFVLPPLQILVPDPERNSYSRQIRELLSDVIRTSSTEHRRSLSLDYMVNGVKLLALLADCCAQPEGASAAVQPLPLLQAIAFTSEHFREPITVKDAAVAARYSAPYFSKLFSSFVGLSFTDFLTELRLQEAERLLQSGATISQTASRCGFSDHRAFARAYRKKHGQNPSDARRIQPPPLEQVQEAQPISPTASQLLTACLDNLSTDSQLPIRFQYSKLPDVSLAQQGIPFPHTWQRSIGAGRARHLLYAKNQEMLRSLQSHIGYQRAILHSLLDDDMQVAHLEEDGSLSFNFDNIDMVFDFLLSIGLAPVVQLGFMPAEMARNRDNLVYEHNSISSLPKDIGTWCRLVRTLVIHLFRRYGQSVVEGWEFCLWSKPDSYPLVFAMPDVDAYFSFYRQTYQAIKGCSRKVTFGSPAFIIDSMTNTAWLEEFFALCKQHNCLPDRLRFDFYPVFVPAPSYDIGTAAGLQHHSNSDSMQSSLQRISDFCDRHNLPYEKTDLEEWNFSISQRELLNDTVYKAVYIVKNVLECWDKSDDFSYWGFSDTLGETALTSELFHGGLGLFAKGQLRKPAYYAFLLLSRLGDRVIAQGEGYIVTTRRQDIQVLFYNYCHYSAIYASGESLNLSFSNRYAPFVDQRRNRFSLQLNDLPESHYLLTQYRLNRQHGSVFDNWLEMGMVTPTTQEEYDYLQGLSQPLLSKEHIIAEDHTYQLSPELAPFELCLFDLHPLSRDEEQLFS